jgi:glycosyltransferase involved in cell wall biosynthesis
MCLDCIESLRRTSWPAEAFEIVLVDNASADGVAAEVERRWPDVRVVTSRENLGFAGGINLGVDALADVPDIEYVALINNDVTVPPEWLAPLVDTLESRGDDVGAACPKIRFATPYVELGVHNLEKQHLFGDPRVLGVRLSGLEVDGVDVWRRMQLIEGFWGPEYGGGDESEYQWTKGAARLRERSGSVRGAAAPRRARRDPGSSRVEFLGPRGDRRADTDVVHDEHHRYPVRGDQQHRRVPHT